MISQILQTGSSSINRGGGGGINIKDRSLPQRPLIPSSSSNITVEINVSSFGSAAINKYNQNGGASINIPKGGGGYTTNNNKYNDKNGRCNKIVDITNTI